MYSSLVLFNLYFFDFYIPYFAYNQSLIIWIKLDDINLSVNNFIRFSIFFLDNFNHFDFFQRNITIRSLILYLIFFFFLKRMTFIPYHTYNIPNMIKLIDSIYISLLTLYLGITTRFYWIFILLWSWTTFSRFIANILFNLFLLYDLLLFFNFFLFLSIQCKKRVVESVWIIK